MDLLYADGGEEGKIWSDKDLFAGAFSPITLKVKCEVWIGGWRHIALTDPLMAFKVPIHEARRLEGFLIKDVMIFSLNVRS